MRDALYIDIFMRICYLLISDHTGANICGLVLTYQAGKSSTEDAVLEGCFEALHLQLVMVLLGHEALFKQPLHL